MEVEGWMLGADISGAREKLIGHALMSDCVDPSWL